MQKERKEWGKKFNFSSNQLFGLCVKLEEGRNLNLNETYHYYKCLSSSFMLSSFSRVFVDVYMLSVDSNGDTRNNNDKNGIACSLVALIAIMLKRNYDAHLTP